MTSGVELCVLPEHVRYCDVVVAAAGVGGGGTVQGHVVMLL